MKLPSLQQSARRSAGMSCHPARLFPGLFAAIWLSGCATCPRETPLVMLPDNGQNQSAVTRAQQTIAGQFPPCYRATQRAIVTVGRQQFTCDGVLTTAPGEGWQLAVVSSLGTVTSLRVKPAGAVEILKVTPLFREDWSRRFVAEDLRRLFAPPRDLKPAGRLTDGRLVLQTDAGADGEQSRYIFSADGERWQGLELVCDSRSFYRVCVRRSRTFAGVPGEIPCEFEVDAPSHRLELRMTELSIPPASGKEAVP